MKTQPVEMTPVPVQIQRVWAAIPSTNCLGLCTESCGPIMASDIEEQLLAERGITILARRPEQVLAALAVTRDCPALVDGRCSVYEVRPTICRLWGAADKMPCPHGCVPDGGHLSERTSARLLRQANEHGQRGSRAARRR